MPILGRRNTGGAEPTTPTSSSTDVSTPASVETSRSGTPIPNGAKAEAAAPPDGQVQSDTGKLKTFLMILKRFIGVSDIAAVRFSLPAQLLEPIPNLEYWHYLDRPETFVAIGDSDDELGRMLGCLKFWFTKDLKYVKGRPCKPYNSALGEFFRCQWTIEDGDQPSKGEESKSGLQETPTAPSGGTIKNGSVKVSYITEQTSHHPPVSAFYVDCPDKGISACGYDQLSAKFTGTSVRVTPGQYNQGIFITLDRHDGEEYHLTHPAAFLCGFLRGNLYVTVSDTCAITCKKTGIKVLLHYLDESYFGRTQNKVEGVVYRCDVENDKTTRIKDVPSENILGRVDGCWMDKVYFSRGPTEFKKAADDDKILLIDVNPLWPAQKVCPPLEDQLPNESRRFWGEVTEAIQAKQYSTATSKKTELEERQRERAKRREMDGKPWQPRFFTTATEPDGRPRMSDIGKTAMRDLHDGKWHLDIPEEYGAM